MFLVAALHCHIQARHSYYSIIGGFLHFHVDEDISRNGSGFTKIFLETINCKKCFGKTGFLC